MDEVQRLYDEAKPDCQVLVDVLLGFAVRQMNKRGGFAPFGAALDASAGIELHAAYAGSDAATSAEVLPVLQEGLRRSLSPGMRAVAMCDWVKITPAGSRQTDAAKVLVEHSNGLSVAFYLPMTKRLFGRWKTGEMIVQPARAEIRK